MSHTLATLNSVRFGVEHELYTTTCLPSGIALVFASQSTEDRGRHPVWDDAVVALPQRCVQVDVAASSHHEVALRRNGSLEIVRLREPSELARGVAAGTGGCLIDVSGLPHHLWAPMVRASLLAGLGTQAMYVEPATYRSQQAPSAAADSFDLSSGFDGVRPIAGFERLARTRRSRRSVYVPLLGFEGSRPKHLLNELDPEMTVPIIGLPGFRADFPTVAIAANRSFLRESGGSRKLRYARAACPFDAFLVLDEILSSEQADVLQVAPIGTKPHALGAVLFAIKRGARAEVVYDHPHRRAHRTAGVGITHVYDVSGFMSRVA
jgi:hypothetical protein